MLFVYRYTSKQITCIHFIGGYTPNLKSLKIKLKGGKDPPTIFNFIGIECKCKNCIFVRVRRSRLTAAEPPAHAQNAHIM